MAFQEIMPKTKEGILFKDCVYVNRATIKFSTEFWEKELSHADRVRLFYDEDTNQVVLLPILLKGEKSGFKVSMRGSSPTVNWKKLVETAKLSFSKTTSFQITNSGDKKERMRIFNLTNGVCLEEK